MTIAPLSPRIAPATWRALITIKSLVPDESTGLVISGLVAAQTIIQAMEAELVAQFLSRV
jgi:hypothetical protein